MSESDTEKLVHNLYSGDDYIAKHPSLHEQDSPWKFSRIAPLVDEFIGHAENGEVNLLDVGGGAGLILKWVSAYIERSSGIQVNKFALDLSPGMLEIQRENNPDLKRALNEDVRRTSLGGKEMDLTLVIDVLEHVPNPTEALEEIKRVSKFVILKVPLEDNLIRRTWYLVERGKPRKHTVEYWGHINVYNRAKLENQIRKHAGVVLNLHYTNVSDYARKSDHYRRELSAARRLVYYVASQVFRLSPRLCSVVFEDFVVTLVKCY